MIVENIRQAVGNTPLLLVPQGVHGIDNLTLYCKLEYMNPWWSLKDRPATYMVEKNKDHLKKNRKIIESSSGNMMKSLAMTSVDWKPQMLTITNRIKVPQQLDVLWFQWVEVDQTLSKSECLDFGDKDNPVALIEKLVAEEGDWLYTDQYRNKDSEIAHYEGTGSEIVADIWWDIDYCFVWLGTTWSTNGIYQAITDNQESPCNLVWIVSTEDDFIPGIRNRREMNEVGIFNPWIIDDIVPISWSEAALSNVYLIKNLWTLCGPTTGSVFAGIQKYFSWSVFDEPKVAVFIACDRVEPYTAYIKERLDRKEIIEESMKTKEVMDVVWDEEIHITSIEQKHANQIVIDTRMRLAYESWHIPWSINIPEQQLMQLLEKTHFVSPEQRVILVCATGDSVKHIAHTYYNKWYNRSYLEWWFIERKKKHRP